MSEHADHGHDQEVDQPRSPKPRVWIASLADYNAGRLHGAWVDADQEPDGIWADIERVLTSSPVARAEEWAVFDFEDFGAVSLSEYESVERISRLGRGIAEHGLAFAAFAGYLGLDDDQLLASFEDCYLGQWESAAGYVEEYLEETGIEAELDRVVPDSLRPYVQLDAEALARDMQCDGSMLAVDDQEGGVYLFHPP